MRVGAVTGACSSAGKGVGAGAGVSACACSGAFVGALCKCI